MAFTAADAPLMTIEYLVRRTGEFKPGEVITVTGCDAATGDSFARSGEFIGLAQSSTVTKDGTPSGERIVPPEHSQLALSMWIVVDGTRRRLVVWDVEIQSLDAGEYSDEPKIVREPEIAKSIEEAVKSEPARVVPPPSPAPAAPVTDQPQKEVTAPELLYMLGESAKSIIEAASIISYAASVLSRQLALLENPVMAKEPKSPPKAPATNVNHRESW